MVLAYLVLFILIIAVGVRVVGVDVELAFKVSEPERMQT